MNARKENRTLPYALIVKGIAVGCFAGLTAVVYRKLLSVAETVVFEAFCGGLERECLLDPRADPCRAFDRFFDFFAASL